jgi:uncharacterized repeat protein (TIGR03803 family)
MTFQKQILATVSAISIATLGASAVEPTILYNFTNGSDGSSPIWYGNLVADGKGNLYGTASEGGYQSSPCFGICGSVFELSPSSSGWTETTLYEFNGGSSDGAQPDAGLAFDKAGNLYGTTVQGGAFCGTVFKLTPSGEGGWTESIIHSFGTQQNDGCEPTTGVMVDDSGNIFGTAGNGGASGFGMAYELTNSGGTWSETVLHSFSFTGDGYNPQSSLVMDSAGNLYGTTLYGGTSGLGTVYELSPSAGGVE